MSSSTLSGRVRGYDTVRRVMSTTFGAERRRHPRIYSPFPVTVRGVNKDGEPFECSTVTDNLSAGGMYLRIMEAVEAGARVQVTTHLSAAAGRGAVAEIKGKVLRVDHKPSITFGLAIKAECHQLP
jgi:c-di-GMP-binding flagellar brake protein YcgR